MKTPRLLALAALAALPAAAPAQSSLTLYGRLDLSVDDLHFSSTAKKPGASVATVSSDTSWWGVRGTEDLGDGARAYFKLENGFQADTGAQTNPSALFNRESYVGLGQSGLGSVQVGSQFSGSIALSAKTDPFIRSNLGGQFALLQGLRGYAIQYQNAVQYLSPNVAGFTLRALASAGERAATGNSYSGEMEYARGGFLAGINYDKVHVVAATVGLTGVPVISQTAAVGAVYDAGPVKLHGWYQRNFITGLPDVSGYMLGLTIPTGAVSELRASVSHREARNADASLGGLGYFYRLSKRTELYTVAAHLNNSHNTSFMMWPPGPDIASQGYPAAGQKIVGYQAGMRHVW